MAFNSVQFLVFLPVVLLVCFCLPKRVRYLLNSKLYTGYSLIFTGNLQSAAAFDGYVFVTV